MDQKGTMMNTRLNGHDMQWAKDALHRMTAHFGEADHSFRAEADHRIRSSRSPLGAK